MSFTGATKPSEINPGLICPIFDELLPCLPKTWRKKLHFGVRHEDVSFFLFLSNFLIKNDMEKSTYFAFMLNKRFIVITTILKSSRFNYFPEQSRSKAVMK